MPASPTETVTHTDKCILPWNIKYVFLFILSWVEKDNNTSEKKEKRKRKIEKCRFGLQCSHTEKKSEETKQYSQAILNNQ